MENALHPHAIRSLTSTIREIANKRNLTVVLSTHSPVLLDEFRDDPASVHVLGSDVNNEVTPLSELRDPDWLAHFSLGALYSEQEFGARKRSSEATTIEPESQQ
jgi:predicted ATPase